MKTCMLIYRPVHTDGRRARICFRSVAPTSTSLKPRSPCSVVSQSLSSMSRSVCPIHAGYSYPPRSRHIFCHTRLPSDRFFGLAKLSVPHPNMSVASPSLGESSRTPHRIHRNVDEELRSGAKAWEGCTVFAAETRVAQFYAFRTP